MLEGLTDLPFKSTSSSVEPFFISSKPQLLLHFMELLPRLSD